jgi:hypothetical protein
VLAVTFPTAAAVQEYFGDTDVEVVGSETRSKLDELLFLRRCVFFSGVGGRSPSV